MLSPCFALARSLHCRVLPAARGRRRTQRTVWSSPGALPATGKKREATVAVASACISSTGAAVASCWGRLGLAALWGRLRMVGLPRRHRRTYVLSVSAGGLNYDPLSYAQNFDDGSLGEREPGFAARFVPTRNTGEPPVSRLQFPASHARTAF